MAASKTYLSVPYAQKDEAKALGARWDASNKKWYVPADKDITLFTRWQTEVVATSSETTKTATLASKSPTSNGNAQVGVFTYPADKNFVAYNGHEPPWD